MLSLDLDTIYKRAVASNGMTVTLEHLGDLWAMAHRVGNIRQNDARDGIAILDMSKGIDISIWNHVASDSHWSNAAGMGCVEYPLNWGVNYGPRRPWKDIEKTLLRGLKKGGTFLLMIGVYDIPITL